MDYEKLERRIKWFRRSALTVGLLGLVIFLFGLLFFDLDELGVMGDFLSGTVGTMWALTGIFLIYIAFLGQQKQMLLYEKEIKINEISSYKQNFDQTFFQFLNAHKDILKNIKLYFDGSTVQIVGDKILVYDKEVNLISGKDCFKPLYEEYIEYYKDIIDKISGDEDGITIYGHVDIPMEILANIKEDDFDEIINISFMAFFHKYHLVIGHYFRNLFHLVEYVAESQLKNEQKLVYMSIIRAQLSSFELLLLFYNCLSDKGRSKFKPYIEDYQLVRNLPKRFLIDFKHLDFYEGLEFEEDEYDKIKNKFFI